MVSNKALNGRKLHLTNADCDMRDDANPYLAYTRATMGSLRGESDKPSRSLLRECLVYARATEEPLPPIILTDLIRLLDSNLLSDSSIESSLK